MPCDQVSTTNIELKAANAELLRDAIQQQLGVPVTVQTWNANTLYFQIRGYDATISRSGGLQIESRRPLNQKQKDEIASEVNRAYAKQVVTVNAKKRGWTLTATKTGFKATKKSSSSQIPLDSMDIEITQTGVVKITTPRISTPNHANADTLIREVETLLGGSNTVVARKQEKPIKQAVAQQVQIKG